MVCLKKNTADIKLLLNVNVGYYTEDDVFLGDKKLCA